MGSRAPAIFFVNTITGLEKNFNTLCDEIIKVKTVKKHISDESLIVQILAARGLTENVRLRFLENIVSAKNAGADIIQVTCSSVTPLIEQAQALVDIPVLSVDSPMAEIAAARYSRLGVIATNPGTLVPSILLLEKTAQKFSKKIDLVNVLCEEAYTALMTGDMQLHDSIVMKELMQLMSKVDAVVLAQASMARIVELMDEKDKTVPVLSSPRLAVEHLAGVVESLGVLI